MYYAEACNEFAEPISASLRPVNPVPFGEMLQRWRAVGNSVSDLTGPRFEPQTIHSSAKCVTARPTGRLKLSFDKPAAANAKKAKKAPLVLIIALNLITVSREFWIICYAKAGLMHLICS